MEGYTLSEFVSDEALQDEAIATQIYISQLSGEGEKESNKEAIALYLALLASLRLSTLTVDIELELEKLYANFEDNLQSDSRFVSQFSFNRYHEVLTGKKNEDNIPEEAILSLSAGLLLKGLTDSIKKVRMTSEIAKIKRNHTTDLKRVFLKYKDNPTELRYKLKNLHNVYKNRNLSVSQTFLGETMRVAREAVESSLPFALRPKYYMYAAVLDSRTTFYCASQAFSVRTSPTAWPILPPAHWRCRSQILPVMDKSKIAELQARAGIDNWMQAQSDSFVLQYLGKKRYELYKDGKIKGVDLVNAITGKRRTLEELRRL